MHRRGGKSWRWLTEINISPLVAALPLLEWIPSDNVGNFGMIDKIPDGFLASLYVERLLPFYVGRSVGVLMVSKLMPGQLITPHQDEHDSRCRFRIHIPIVANPQCIFVVNDEAFVMVPGNAYEIDPMETHMTVNLGTTERIHLIFNMKE